MTFTETQADFLVQDEGSIIMLTPLSPEAQQWVDCHIPDDAPRFGAAVCIERRFARDIAQGIVDAGMEVI